MVKRPEVVWNLRASRAFRSYCDRIREDSPQNAQYVQKEITDAVDQLLINPERYPLDKYKLSNLGSYRAFEKLSLRIAYRYSEKEIRILRCRHVKQKPTFY